MSTAKFDTLQNAAGSKSVPVATVVDGSAKAWVSFNGTGTVAIRAAFNVSSVSDNGVGDYTLNFASAMPDANYAYSGACSYNDATNNNTATLLLGKRDVAPTASALRVITVVPASVSTISDFGIVNVAIFR